MTILLDIPTLLVVAALSTTVCGCVMLVAQDSSTDNESLRTWGLSMLLGAIAFVTAIIGRDNPSIGIEVSTTLILLSRGMGWTGARRFNSKPPILLAAMAGGIGWGLMIPLLNRATWLIGANIIATAYLAVMIIELRPRPGERLRSRGLLLILLSLQIVVFMLRTSFAITGGTFGPWADTIMRGIILQGTVHTVAAALLMIALVKEQVERKAVLQMRSMAMADALTGIGNRRLFDEQLVTELRRARRQATSIALLLVDVDNFKRFNDEHGHQVGDTCLRLIANTIESLIRRPGDLVARYGGEEFGVILPDTSLAGATALAETIRRTIHGLATAEMPKATLTVSIGVAATVPNGEDPVGLTLVAAADQALYAAKKAGRNRVVGQAPLAVAAAGG